MIVVDSLAGRSEVSTVVRHLGLNQQAAIDVGKVFGSPSAAADSLLGASCVLFIVGGIAAAAAVLLDLQTHCLKKAMPPEICRLGRTIRDWFAKIVNFHVARVSNGPTEALNDLVERIKRIGFGFRNFENYRIRPCSARASRTGGYSARSSFGEQADPTKFRCP